MSAFLGGPGKSWVSSSFDAANLTFEDYAVDGLLVFESLHLEAGSPNLTASLQGRALRIGDNDTSLVLSNEPTGLVNFRGADGALVVTVPHSAQVQPSADGGIARIEFAAGNVGHMRFGHALWLDERTVLADGFFAFLLELPAPSHGEGVAQAIVERKVGAEVALNRPTEQPDAGPKVQAYDAIDVKVRLPDGQATPSKPIRVEVSAELDEGRTVVLHVNRSLLESLDPADLVLRYYDLEPSSLHAVVEREVAFHAARDLADVLDAGDDDGPEYWVVADANGIQVLASIPHWSAHAITIASAAAILPPVAPSVALGITVGLVASVVATVALLWPRRSKPLA